MPLRRPGLWGASIGALVLFSGAVLLLWPEGGQGISQRLHELTSLFLGRSEKSPDRVHPPANVDEGTPGAATAALPPQAPAGSALVLGWDGERPSLSGTVGSEADRRTVLDTVKLDYGEAADGDLTVAPNVRPVSSPALGFVLARLGHFARANIVVDGPAVTLEGEARTPELHAALQSDLATPPQGIEIARAAIEPATVSPFQVSVAREGRDLTLTGHVLSREMGERLAAIAREVFPNRPVTQRLLVARGIPEGLDLAEATRFALERLRRVERGEAVIADGRLTLTGTGLDADAPREIAAALAGPLPAGLVAGSVAVGPPAPGDYALRLTRRNDTVVVAGRIPGEEERAAILREVRSRFLTERVVEEVDLAAGAPDGFGRAANAAAAELSRLATGEAVIGDRTVSLTGTALYEQVGEAAQRRLAAALPTGWTGRTEVNGPKVAALSDNGNCQGRLSARLAEEPVRFETASAEIDPASAPLLDAMAEILKGCAEARVEIAGHTDAEGDPGRNRELSQRRAQAVLDALSAREVSPRRLSAVGYGETKPVASNENEEGRARNRRIELLVVPPR